MRCPCRGCPDRTITCHGFCERYRDWREVFEKEKEWKRRQNPIYSETCKKKLDSNAIRKARGWTRSHGKNND